jgi:hypothetical protein
MMQPVQPNPGGFQYHIIGADGCEYGPVALDGLQAWLAQGQMTAQAQVRRSHEAQWQPAMSLPELQPMLGTVGGPPVVGPVMQQAPVDPAKEATAKKLVLASHIMGYGGLVMMFGGAIVAGIALGGTAAAIVGGIGLLMAIIGAIVGQVGRGMQGRAI